MSNDAADRGMGRYTQQQLEAVLDGDRENEYVVMLFPGCREDVISRTVAAADNVVLERVSVPTLANGILGVPEGEVLRFSAELQRWLFERDVDVYHATTPFLPPVASDIDVCPVVATLYDLIPLVYPGEYFPQGKAFSVPLRGEYYRGLELLGRARRLVAISESAARDAAAYLGYPSERSTVAYPLIEPHFGPLSPDGVEASLAGLHRRAPLPDDFMLSVTGAHHSKNAATLLAAHRRLFARERLPLVVVLPTQGAYELFADTFPRQDGVTLLTAVSDGELCALFNAARLVVHPSR
jgi:glycosyltransferase involved in cell wall biosynthesis